MATVVGIPRLHNCARRYLKSGGACHPKSLVVSVKCQQPDAFAVFALQYDNSLFMLDFYRIQRSPASSLTHKHGRH